MVIETLKATVCQHARKAEKISDIANVAKDRDELIFNNMNANIKEGNFIIGTIESEDESEEEDTSSGKEKDDIEVLTIEEKSHGASSVE